MFNSEALDDPLLTDEVTSFAGGQVSVVKPQNLGPDEWHDLENVDVDRTGRGKSRPGTVSVGTTPDAFPVRGMFFYEGTNDYLMRVANGALTSFDGSNWAAVAGYTPSSGNNVEMAQLIDNLYLTDGSGVYTWNGTGSASAVVGSPAGRYIVSHTGRLFVAGFSSVTDKIQPSAFETPGTWSDPSFRVGSGDGEGITGIASWHNFLLAVFKRNATYVVNADPTVAVANWEIQVVHSRVGCVSNRTIQAVGTDIYFLADDGVRTLKRTINEQQIGVDAPISHPMQDFIDRINWSSVNTACSAFINNRYMLAVPLDSATTPNYVLVYNTLLQKWSGYWTGWNPLIFSLSRFSGQKKLVFGQNNGTTWEFLDYIASPTFEDYTDDGEYYDTVMTTRGMFFGDIKPPKTGYSYEVEFYGSDSTGEVRIILDGQTIERASYAGRTRGQLLTLPFTLPATLGVSGSFPVAEDLMSHGPFRSVQFMIRANRGKLAVQRVAAYGFMDTIEAERNVR
jgi:hypothetical protein